MRRFTKFGWQSDTAPKLLLRIPVSAPPPEPAQPVEIKPGRIVIGRGRYRRGPTPGAWRQCYGKKAEQACAALRQRL